MRRHKMSTYDLAMDAIQEGRIHSKLSDMIEFFEQLNIEEQNDYTC